MFHRQNSVSLCPASFCTPRPNLPVITGVSLPPTFAFKSPMMKRTSFRFYPRERTCEVQFRESEGGWARPTPRPPRPCCPACLKNTRPSRMSAKSFRVSRVSSPPFSLPPRPSLSPGPGSQVTAQIRGRARAWGRGNYRSFGGGEFRSPANGSGPFSSISVPLGNVPCAVFAVS